jgi:hypothetical protein
MNLGEKEKALAQKSKRLSEILSQKPNKGIPKELKSWHQKVKTARTEYEKAHQTWAEATKNNGSRGNGTK